MKYELSDEQVQNIKTFMVAGGNAIMENLLRALSIPVKEENQDSPVSQREETEQK